MLEALLGTKYVDPSIIQDPSLLLYLDFESVIKDRSPKKQTIALAGNGVLSTDQKVSGAQSFYTQTTGQLGFPTAAFKDIGSGDYSIEFNHYSLAGTGYKYLFVSVDGNGNGMYVRFGDSGFGNRLMIAVNASTVAGCYSTDKTITTQLNKWVKYVVQRKAGQISFWIDGVQQTMKNNNYAGPAVTSFADATVWGSSSSNQLGNTQLANNAGYFDDVIVRKVAKY